MDLKEFFGTDWRAMMSDAALDEASRLNGLCPLDRAKVGWQLWQEDASDDAETVANSDPKAKNFKGDLKWNLWAKAYKNEFLVNIKEGGDDPFGNGKRQIRMGDADYLERSIDFSQGQQREPNGLIEIDHGQFSRFIFPGRVSFEGLLIKEEAHFAHALFTSGAVFKKTDFKKRVYFSSTIFNKEPQFSRALFEKEVCFRKTIFNGKSDFSITSFAEGANFSDAIFTKRASFNMAAFTGNACMKGVIFKGDAHFRHALFTQGADFTYVTFKRQAIFHHTLFHCHSDFSFCVASELIDFSDAYFLNRSDTSHETDFSHMQIEGSMLMENVGFGSTRYYNPDDPHNLKAKKLIESYELTSRDHTVPNFIGLKVPKLPDLSSAVIKYHSNMVDMLASAKFRKLKDMAIETHDHGREVEYFREEFRHKKHSGEALSWARFYVWFYEVFARCGTSALRPALWILALIPIFAIGYIYLSPTWILAGITPAQALEFLEFSLYQTLPLLEYSGLGTGGPTDFIYGGAGEVPSKVWFLSLAHKVTTLTLGFFIGLGTWNHFKK